MEALIPVIQTLAPTVATVLSGPLGGPLLRYLAGMLQAKSAAPADVAKAVDDPTAASKLVALEALLAAQASANELYKDSIDLVAKAYQAELGRGFFWSGLRPTAAWALIALTTAYSVLSLKAAALGVYLPMDHGVSYLTVLSPLAAVTGVYFYGRSQEKQTILGQANGPSTANTGATTVKATTSQIAHR